MGVQYQAINDQEGYIVHTAAIEKGWHIYSQKATDAGPIPTSFSYVSSGAYELVGATEEEAPHEIYDKAFDAKVWTFDGKVMFRQKIRLKNTKGFVLSPQSGIHGLR